MTAPPPFASIQEFGSRLGDVGFWWPYVAEILERHDLADAGWEPLAGAGGTYPAVLYGDIALKLFGYARSWRASRATERATQTLIATDARDLNEEVRPRVADEVDTRLADSLALSASGWAALVRPSPCPRSPVTRITAPP